MYIFKYHPDNTIYRNDKYWGTYEKFKAENPDFPIIEGEFFEYGEEEFTRINIHGHHLPSGGAKYQALIQAINNLQE